MNNLTLNKGKIYSPAGLATVSPLQSKARLYLQLSQDDLSAAATSSPFMFFTFLISSPFLALVQPRQFLKCVKLSLNHSLQPALPTILYEQIGVLLLLKLFLRGRAALEAEILSLVILASPKKHRFLKLNASVREEKADFQAFTKDSL